MSKKMTKAQYKIVAGLNASDTFWRLWKDGRSTLDVMTRQGWVEKVDINYQAHSTKYALTPAGFVAMQECKVVSK